MRDVRRDVRRAIEAVRLRARCHPCNPDGRSPPSQTMAGCCCSRATDATPFVRLAMTGRSARADAGIPASSSNPVTLQQLSG